MSLGRPPEALETVIFRHYQDACRLVSPRPRDKRPSRNYGPGLRGGKQRDLQPGGRGRQPRAVMAARRLAGL